MAHLFYSPSQLQKMNNSSFFNNNQTRGGGNFRGGNNKPKRDKPQQPRSNDSSSIFGGQPAKNDVNPFGTIPTQDTNTSRGRGRGRGDFRGGERGGRGRGEFRGRGRGEFRGGERGGRTTRGGYTVSQNVPTNQPDNTAGNDIDGPNIVFNRDNSRGNNTRGKSRGRGINNPRGRGGYNSRRNEGDDTEENDNDSMDTTKKFKRKQSRESGMLQGGRGGITVPKNVVPKNNPRRGENTTENDTDRMIAVNNRGDFRGRGRGEFRGRGRGEFRGGERGGRTARGGKFTISSDRNSGNKDNNKKRPQNDRNIKSSRNNDQGSSRDKGNIVSRGQKTKIISHILPHADYSSDEDEKLMHADNVDYDKTISFHTEGDSNADYDDDDDDNDTNINYDQQISFQVEENSDNDDYYDNDASDEEPYDNSEESISDDDDDQGNNNDKIIFFKPEKPKPQPKIIQEKPIVLPAVINSPQKAINKKQEMIYTKPKLWNPTSKYDNQIIKPNIGKYGVIQTMCSPNEFESRETFEPFEYNPKTKQPDINFTIARYSRPASDNINTNNDMRSIDTLIKTTNYIFKNVLPLSRNQFLTEKYQIIIDYFREIRKQLTTQQIYTPKVTEMLENMLRSIVILSYKAIGDNISRKFIEDAFMGTYLSLVDYGYPVCKELGISCPNEPEMVFYYCTFHIAGLSPAGAIPLKIYQNYHILSTSKHYLDLALRICSDISNCNYYSFFNTLKTSHILVSLVMFTNAHYVRSCAIDIIKGAIKNSDKNEIHFKLTNALFFDNKQQMLAFIAAPPTSKLFKSQWIDDSLELYSWYYLACNCTDENEIISSSVGIFPVDIHSPISSSSPHSSPVKEKSPQPSVSPTQIDFSESDDEEELLLSSDEEKDIEPEEKKKIPYPPPAQEEEKEEEEEEEEEEDNDELREIVVNELNNELDSTTDALKEIISTFTLLEEERIWRMKKSGIVVKYLAQKPLQLKREVFQRWIDFTQKAKDFQQTFYEDTDQFDAQLISSNSTMGQISFNKSFTKPTNEEVGILICPQQTITNFFFFFPN